MNRRCVWCSRLLECFEVEGGVGEKVLVEGEGGGNVVVEGEVDRSRAQTEVSEALRK